MRCCHEPHRAGEAAVEKEKVAGAVLRGPATTQTGDGTSASAAASLRALAVEFEWRFRALQGQEADSSGELGETLEDWDCPQESIDCSIDIIGRQLLCSWC